MNNLATKNKPSMPNDRKFCRAYTGNYWDYEDCSALKPTKDNRPFCTFYGELLDIMIDDQVPFPIKCQTCKDACQVTLNPHKKNGRYQTETS